MKLPQLSLRDLFWLVALVAMGCGWWVDRSWVLPNQLFVQERKAKWPNFNRGDYSLRVIGLLDGPRPEVPWIRKLMGDSPTATLLYDPTADPDGSQLEVARRLFPEATIWGWPGETDLPPGMEALDANRYFII